MKKRLFALLIAISVVCTLLIFSAFAESTETVSYQVTYKQTDARSILKMVNSFRTGNDAWEWNESDTTQIYHKNLQGLVYDYSLEKIAMQRAAEIAIMYSHTRPNNERCFSAYNISYTAAGENIAAGYSSPEAVFEGWQETNYKYAGQGHRRNMLSEDFNAIGIACVYYNNCYYWVQEFGRVSAPNTTATTANNSLTTVKSQVAASVLSSVNITSGSSPITVGVGKTTALPSVTTEILTNETWPGYVCAVTPTYKWVSSDPSVAEISNGKLVGVSAGTAKLTVSALGKSLDISVKVTSALEISKQPSNLKAASGKTGKFTVTASGDGLKYQWQYQKPGTTTWVNSTAASGKTATLSVNVREAINGYKYRCKVTNANGNSVTSSIATLTVTPGITKQPANIKAQNGTTGKLTITAAGDGLSYQWQYQKPGTTTWVNCTAASCKTATLSVNAREAIDGYKYRCVVKNSCGNSITSSVATLTVVYDLAITKQPTNLTAASGTTGKLKVTAVGTGLSYQWQYMKPGTTTWVNCTAASGKTATLSVNVRDAINGYKYHCIVKDTLGDSVTSNTVTLKVN